MIGDAALSQQQLGNMVGTSRESINKQLNQWQKEGLIGILMCDSGQSPKSVAPFGGREARLGTNPLSIAVPGEERASWLHTLTTQHLTGLPAWTGSELIVVEQCGHLVTMEKPEETNAILRKWLSA